MWQRLNSQVAAALASPMFWGSVATIGFYWAISAGAANGGPLSGGFVERYFASHWAEYLETSMFFVGGAALLIRAWDTRSQAAQLGEPLLAHLPRHARTADAVDAVLAHLKSLSPQQQASHLSQRLTAATEHVRRQRSADSLDDQLKYLTDEALDRAHASYGLVRTVAWAIPIVGFLGTVIGITLAIANLSPEALDESLTNVTAGLGVAFDTTAVALSMSIVLMFTLFAVERQESRLLAEVDRRAADELADMFASDTTTSDPQLLAVRRMIEEVVHANQQLVRQQADVWTAALDQTNARWQSMVDEVREGFNGAFATALHDGLEDHARRVAAIEADLASQTHGQWQAATESMTQVARQLTAVESGLTERTGAMLKISDTADEVNRLQSSLDANLAAVTGTGKFDETLLSLSTAIQLLAARANLTLTDGPNPGGGHDTRGGHAA
jgi:biopolymer transport protein ExbB/TolQ